VFATVIAHEPPLLGLLADTPFEPVLRDVNTRAGHVIDRLDAGDDEAGAKLFVETVARRPGAWDEELTAELREVYIGNAPTFLDEARDPDGQRLDLDQLRRFDRPGLLTKGAVSPRFLIAIVDTMASALPSFEVATIEGADHAPHQTTPRQYIELVRRFVEAAHRPSQSRRSITPRRTARPYRPAA
jgi:pimeloyl-ACP methyl ester carboxylesterase